MASVQIIIIIVLTLINGFFAASEMAIVSLRENKIQLFYNEKRKGSEKLMWLHKHPNRFLSTLQVGITLAGFFSSATAAKTLSDDLAIIFEKIGIANAQGVSFIVITLLLSYFVLVFGELFPKRIGLRYKEKIALRSSGIIYGLSVLTRPFVWLLTTSTKGLMRLFRIADNKEDRITREEIKTIVHLGEEQGAIDEEEQKLLERVIDLDEIYVQDVMTPRTKVFAVEFEDLCSEYLAQIIHSSHSRIPVYQDNHDKIIGILYVKDVFKEAYENGFAHIDYHEILRPVHLILETRPIDEVLREFQQEKTQMGIVIDEYGSFSGIITVEEILEEIVGDIDDEYDALSSEIVELEKGYVVDGFIALTQINQFFDLEISSNDYTRLNGFLLANHSQEALEEGNKINFFGRSLEILKRNEKVIEKVFISK